LVHVHAGRPLAARAMWVGMGVVGFAVLAGFLSMRWTLSVGKVAGSVVMMTIVAAVFILWFSSSTVWSRWRIRAAARQISRGETGDFSSAWAVVARTVSPYTAAKELTACLARQSDARVAYWVAHEPPPANDALTIPFEPVPLDEADAAMRVINSGREHNVDHTAAPHSDACSQWGRIRRNVRLRGLLPVMLVLLGFVGQSAAAIAEGQITVSLLMAGAVVAVMVFAGTQQGWLVRRQWFVVPGGLVVRRASWRRARWTPVLFQRTDAILSVAWMSRRVWLIAVANAHDHAAFFGTACEAAFVLRAWISPLPPPSPEQLSDLE